MNVPAFSGVVFSISLLAGFLGALTGLGGGVVVTPVLILLLGVDFHYAMGASLVSVIATSSGAAAAYVKEGFSNIRLGMVLEIATTLGAVAGAHLTSVVPVPALAVVFGLVLIYSAWHSAREMPEHTAPAADPSAERLRLNGTYPGPSGTIAYTVARVKAGFSLMFGAGLISGLLGIGSGAMKVVAMDQVMRVPFKVSTTTSNFMIGVTAAASAGIYLRHGYIRGSLAMPVMLGVLAGSLVGARLLEPDAYTLAAAAIRGSDRRDGAGNDLQRRERGLEMTDTKLEQIVGNLLRTGVALAATIVSTGGVWYVAVNRDIHPDYSHFHGSRGIFPWIGNFPGPQATIQLGLLVLICTPVARVVFSLIGFVLEGDKLYVGFTLIVLAILAYSLTLS